MKRIFITVLMTIGLTIFIQAQEQDNTTKMILMLNVLTLERHPKPVILPSKKLVKPKRSARLKKTCCPGKNRTTANTSNLDNQKVVDKTTCKAKSKSCAGKKSICKTTPSTGESNM